MDIGQGVSAIGPEELRQRRARFADVEVTIREDSLSVSDRKALKALLKAAEVMHRIFWKQVSPKELERRNELARQAPGADPYLAALLDYVDLNVGPWDRIDGNEPFIGDQKKPEGAAFYPTDMTKEEFEAHLRSHPEDRTAFESPFTVIRREGGRLKAVPYSEEYAQDLKEAAMWLTKAADATTDPVLARFLRSRAEAFLSNDYFESDMHWMDLGVTEGPQASAIDVTIGPYEVYEDDLFNLKAAFEAFVTVRDPEESRKLAVIGRHLDALEAGLPLDDRHKNFSRGKASPIFVVNVVYTAGDANKGVQTAAFNLPNDERVRAAKGSKKVMLKNVMEAKFNNSLIPIAKAIMDPALLPLVSFDAYFNFVLMHEVSHGLGPGFIIMPDGSRTSVNLALKDTYSAIEECKADVLGVFNTFALVKMGVLPADIVEKTMVTYLGGIFRSVRFGVEEAHGKANIMQYNYLRRFGAFTYDPESKRFGVVSERFEDGIRALAHDLLTIEAEGAYGKAVSFLKEYGDVPAEIRDALNRLVHVPVDIRPHYTLANKLLEEPFDE